MFRISAKVDIGVSEECNDDRALVGPNIIEEGNLSELVEDDVLVLAICDGVGGLAAGYKAAMITLDLIKYLNRPGVDNHVIHKAIEEANSRVIKQQQLDNLEHGMRTTIAGLYFDNTRMYVFNAGDSRVYRFRYKYLMQLSKDHSLVQDLIELGEITCDQAKTHQKKNVINKCIGNDSVVMPRIADFSDEIQVGDIYFICSDGVSDVLTDNNICEIILKHKNDQTLDACCQEIYDEAIHQGTLDNLSIVLARKE